MWQKSSFCKADSPMCVEVDGLDTQAVTVRDSRYLNTVFTREEWQLFIDGVKTGEFDLKVDTDADAEEMMDQT